MSFGLFSLAPRTGRGGGDLNVKLPVVAAACHIRLRRTGDTEAELKSFSNSSLSLQEPVGMKCGGRWGDSVVVVLKVVLGGGGGGARAGIFSRMAKLRSRQTMGQKGSGVSDREGRSYGVMHHALLGQHAINSECRHIQSKSMRKSYIPSRSTTINL